jgi:hypothetical protein
MLSNPITMDLKRKYRLAIGRKVSNRTNKIIEINGFILYKDLDILLINIKYYVLH